MDISTFILFKSDINTQELNTEILKKLNILFPDIDKKNRNKNKNKNNILKNQKIQIQKVNISNKVNLILNKLSEKNIDNLVIEFIENINQVNSDSFREIQKAFYLKIISEVNFINIYIEFLKIIGFLYNKVQEYDLSYFFEMIETKFKNDYTDYEINPNDNISFINDLNGETNRTNNLILINTMVEYKLFSNEIYKYCDNIILNQSLFLSDIYYWFNSKNRGLNTHESEKIKEILNKPGILPRDSILLKNLSQEKQINISAANPIKSVVTISTTQQATTLNPQKENDIGKIKQIIIQTNTINLECIHIIDEYILFKSMDDLKYFIDSRCMDTINKNKFCENLINKYFMSNKEISEEIIQLIKQLVKLHILFKSNFSRGLLLIHNNWDDISIDYNNPITKIKLLLSTLKSIGITKGLEELLEIYK
jgi:hypothetical protein